MPSWNDILNEVKSAGGVYDIIRRRYLKALSEKTGRNVIVYYDGWLQKGQLSKMGIPFGIRDSDINGFMSCIYQLDKSKGLDIVLHTPGGGTAATESLVCYLRSIFGNNIRAVIPQLAMSAGTMIACACKEILMGKHSSLGPIDPQIDGLPAHGIIEEFSRAAEEIKKNQLKIPLWQPIIAKYHPTLIGECEKAISWSEEMVAEWLESGMFCGESESTGKIEKIIYQLGSHAFTKSHERHISLSKAQDYGLKVRALEEDNELQDAILSVHHTCIQTLSDTAAVKIIENQNGIAYIQSASPGTSVPIKAEI